MSYAVRNDGKGWRSVNGPDDVGPEESFSEDQPEVVVDKNAAILLRILDEEATITLRRLREALVSGDLAFIRQVENKIVGLRKQMKKP